MSGVLFWVVVYLIVMAITFWLVTTLMRASRDDPPPEERPARDREHPASLHQHARKT